MVTEENRFQEGDLIAVGDIHGRIDLLQKFLKLVNGTGVRLLFLGDLIDRAKNPGDDPRVLASVHILMKNPSIAGLQEVKCLMGNHESMFLSAVKGQTDLWVQNGGSLKDFPQMKSHAEWIKDLPFTHQEGDTLFVHAGIRPGVPLEDQAKEDLVWIRHRFLHAEVLGVEGVEFVVHGHTPNFLGFPVLKRNRLCLDSGAFFSGRLTCFNHRSGEVFQVCD